MKPSPKSLRVKIFLFYVAAAVLVLSFALLSWSNLTSLERMVESGELISDLFDTTLEIRRFEKNFFLYRTAEDFLELQGYVEKASTLVHRPELTLFATTGIIDELRDAIDAYGDMLQATTSAPGKFETPAWQKALRGKGQQIVTIAEGISMNRKAIKRESLISAKRHILFGIAILTIGAIAAGIFFYMKAVMPLSHIQQHMERISSGEFSLIDTQFKDSELISLKIAFNKMLLELQARQTHLVQSEKLASMGTLIFGIAHELNNPLSNIYTSAQILEEEFEDGDTAHKHELIQQILSESERAQSVIGSVLNYSRSKEKSNINLKSAVQETIRLLRADLPPNITIINNIAEDMEIFADKQKIQQVILNLINNAIDAIDPLGNEGEITFSAMRSEGMVELIVQDNGTGMNAETLAKIFDPFYSSKNRDIKKKGYGLGLFVVHNIVKEHGGSISADSSPNVGTVFIITLPVKES